MSRLSSSNTGRLPGRSEDVFRYLSESPFASPAVSASTGRSAGEVSRPNAGADSSGATSGGVGDVAREGVATVTDALTGQEATPCPDCARLERRVAALERRFLPGPRDAAAVALLHVLGAMPPASAPFTRRPCGGGKRSIRR